MTLDELRLEVATLAHQLEQTKLAAVINGYGSPETAKAGHRLAAARRRFAAVENQR
jgi:hypothetical protein